MVNLKTLSNVPIPFCSELCYEAFYLDGGLDIVPDVDEADITSLTKKKSTILGTISNNRTFPIPKFIYNGV